NGSYFWVAKPKVTLSGVENIESILTPTILVQPGQGDKTNHFELQPTPKDQPGVIFILQSEKRGSVSVGTPVLYRDMPVGQVVDVQLGEFADRIISTIRIDSQYAYLVRSNSVFWNTSGLDVSIGLTGANIKSGTLDSILNGGITFATPEGKQLEPIASEEQSFFLYPSPEEKWTRWRTPIPKP
ncbi:MlaD family protein, partial [Vibrio genomosp. F10 str. 9ZC157]|uniref:MlaD family protein n=1 Tax=Vibrio genomosp. F10 TaxID=723171 RepID=UPI00056E55FD